MSPAAPLQLSDGLLELNGIAVLRVCSCALELHEDTLSLVPTLDALERWPVPTARWLEIRAEAFAAPPLQGLGLLGLECTGRLVFATQQLTISGARLAGYRCVLDGTGAREFLTLRCAVWTLEGAS